MSQPTGSQQPSPPASLDKILVQVEAFLFEPRLKLNRDFIQEMYGNLKEWKEANVGKAYEESGVTKLDALWRDFLDYKKGETDDLAKPAAGKIYLARVGPKLGTIGQGVEAITGKKQKHKFAENTQTVTTSIHAHTHAHTTVYDRGPCHICEQQGGGSYGPNVPPGERHEGRPRQDSPVLGSADVLAGCGSWSDTE